MTQDEACAMLEEGHRRVEELLARLPNAALTRPGLGGGGWSPKDLVGHLASWESHGLEACAAWSIGQPAPIDRRLAVEGLSVVNAAEVAAKGAWSAKAVRDDADRLHGELLAKIAGFPVETWNKSTTPRSRRPLWKRLGSILGGPAGPFRHGDAHLADLAAFLAANR